MAGCPPLGIHGNRNTPVKKLAVLKQKRYPQDPSPQSYDYRDTAGPLKTVFSWSSSTSGIWDTPDGKFDYRRDGSPDFKFGRWPYRPSEAGELIADEVAR
jgi:hypothetical protein